MKEVNVILPYEILDPIGRKDILALYCQACQGFLRMPFFQEDWHLSTDDISASHQAKFGKEHQSHLKPTGKIFAPHKRKLPIDPRCV